MEKTFLRNDSIWYTFYKEKATISYLEKIFSNKAYLFFKKTQILFVWRNLNSSVAFYGKFATI